MAIQRGRQLESLIVQKDKKLREQDMIIRAQMKRIEEANHTLHQKTTMLSDYENKFVQVREAVQSDKEHSTNMQKGAADRIEDLELEVAKRDKRVEQLSEERSDLMSQVKEIQWAKDQEVKKLTRELQTINERQIEDQSSHL